MPSPDTKTKHPIGEVTKYFSDTLESQRPKPLSPPFSPPSTATPTATTSSTHSVIPPETIQHMLDRISSLEERLAAASNLPLYESSETTPISIRSRLPETPSLSVQRPRSGTGLTPPPSPKPEEVANAMSDSPFTPTDPQLRQRYPKQTRMHHSSSGSGSGSGSSSSGSSSSGGSGGSTRGALPNSLHGTSGAPSLSFLDYAQLPFRDGPMPSGEPEKDCNDGGAERLRMLRLVRVPYYVECTVNYGFAVALDSFLFYITVLPLRAIYALGLVLASIFSARARNSVRGRHLHDIVQVGIFVTCTVLLTQVEMSRAYHTLRAQSFLKLYVIFNLFDILDKLFCALGQGIYDSLRWTLEHNPKHISTLQYWSQIFAFLLAAVGYTFLHSLLSFSRMVALNVAINTQGSSLLTLLISNNFVELKSSVFKRFQPENLFQITCADIVERFHLFIFMALIGLQNLDKEEDRNIFMWAAPIILGCEFLVDWVKHCFVSNFNRIPLDVYSKFTSVLRHDLTSGYTQSDSNKKQSTRNHAYRVASRIGLVNLPLAVVVVRVLLTQFARQTPSYTASQVFSIAIMAYMCLLAFKMLLDLCLMTHAAAEFNKKRRGKETTNSNDRRSQMLSKDEKVSVLLSVMCV